MSRITDERRLVTYSQPGDQGTRKRKWSLWQKIRHALKSRRRVAQGKIVSLPVFDHTQPDGGYGYPEVVFTSYGVEVEGYNAFNQLRRYIHWVSEEQQQQYRIGDYADFR
jgi:hypothetical protein